MLRPDRVEPGLYTLGLQFDQERGVVRDESSRGPHLGCEEVGSNECRPVPVQTSAMASRAALPAECHARAAHVRWSSDPRGAQRSSTRPESVCSATSDSRSPFERSGFGGVLADHYGSHATLVGPFASDQFTMPAENRVGGDNRRHPRDRRRPRKYPSSPRRRRSPSSKRRRRPPSLDFRTRFSSRRNAIRSVCSR